jgi:adenylate cyclase
VDARTMSTRILVVDDEPDLEALIRQKYRREIGSGEFEFMFARDGIEALDVVAATPDLVLVLSDINMPRMDGLALLAALQEGSDGPATVIVSAYGDIPNIRTAMNRGAFDFLMKPINFDDLSHTISKTCRHVESLRRARFLQLEAERAKASLSRFFSPNLAQRLASDPAAADLSSSRRDVSAMFTDITDFTRLVETLDADVLAPLLNAYLSDMTDVVFAYGGTLAKVVGDAMHVLFGAPGDQPDHASRAVSCALDMDARAEDFRRAWQSRGIDLGRTRIGINAGAALVGNFGGNRYFDYTAYGDSINTAARLEAANKTFGTRICLSEHVVARHPDFEGRPIGYLVLRGRSDPLLAYEPFSGNDRDAAYERAYGDAYAKLEAGDTSAIQAFASLVALRPSDALASFHLRRLLNGEKGTRVDVL